MNTVKLKSLNEGDKFKPRYSTAGQVFQVQHKLINLTGGIGVIQVEPPDIYYSNGGVWHPDADVIPVP